MDGKARAMAAQIVASITTGSFSENDVQMLFLLLRDAAHSQSPVRELADFLAHRERDRGLVHSYIVSNGRALGARQYHEISDREVFAPTAILNSVNSGLLLQGIPAIPLSASNDVTFCVMSLLQDVTFSTDEAGFSAGHLELGVNNGNAVLYATTKARVTIGFNVLQVPNRYFVSNRFESDQIVASSIGKLVAVRFVRNQPLITFVQPAQ